ncbi:MAG: amidohydrolase [Saccharofermentans sp.]|nr:amidohydrolase [Saccharofermentans sp.]
MSVRFYNALILTMETDSVIGGEIWTDNDKISYVGPAKDTQGISFDREIDCKGNLLMPGLKDAHTHTAMVFARSLADDLTLDDWLHKAIFPREAKLGDEHIYTFSKLGFAEYLKGGITSCFDMYFNPVFASKAAIETGFRYVFCGSVNDFGGIDRLEDEYIRYNSIDPLISYKLGFHAEYTTSKEIMQTISEISHKHEAPVFAHISETKAEVEGCIARYGMTPPKLFDSLGLYDFGGGGFHCVWFDDEDMEIYKNRGLYAVFNACSNLKLASGIAPVSRFENMGIPTAIGTDGAGSNNALDMFREMYLDNVMSNIADNKACSIPPFKTLKAATSTGALCMGLDDCDTLKEGKQADIIMIDMNSPCMQPVNNIPANLVYSGNPGIVCMTMIAGRILYEDGNFTTIDIDEVIKDSNRLLKEIL